ncbi:sugar ABC transporter permease [Saccharopolyspora sp. K220]|uniref:carbohydrate ABC transporter permease n=1 Tax=Saccharopolyspora soli TaxID=2926618 RepID=UPI001F573021|nr:sugar ABC transporter permease [Saccharopolyspora soli]MCI2416848.1 sugar ABC transporter permease [Saccharopolyspora soli]
MTMTSERAVEVRTRRPAHKKPTRTSVSFWFAVPCLVLFAAIVAYPTMQGVYYAFTDWSGLGSAIHFNGLDNFTNLFSSPETVGALWHTIVMAAAITVLQNAIGLGLALGLNSRIKSRNVLRTLLFAPVVMTPIIVGYLWQFIFVPGGPVSSLSQLLGSAQGLNVLGDPALAMWGIVAIVVWQHVGYSMVIYLAGMQNIPGEVLEAAVMDGAGPVKRFAWVTWPLLRTPTLINITLSLIMSLKLFDQVLATTQGGPGYATQTLSTLLYNEAFLYNRYGYGIALGLIVFILIAVISFGQMRVFRERD